MQVNTEEVERLGKKAKPKHGGWESNQVGLATKLEGIRLSGWMKSVS